MASLEKLESSLADFRPKKKWYRFFCRRSAVAIIVRDGAHGLEAMMIKRAEREGDPWSGHMAFPGGRRDPQDRTTLAVAQRETWEEIGLRVDQHARHLGRLSDLLAQPRRRLPSTAAMVVTPFVFSVEQLPPLQPNHEVAEVIWVPLQFLADRRNRREMQWQLQHKRISLPCYFFQDRRIWGLSLRMLDELLQLLH